ncbi:uncharacterized protein LOC132195111 [Neocloeon triangulifer]|uniref:uncharacterized protein LOC132195111 n=1 Tax=Neocloeon triangulifer TaxID=2078957 RepID=UPI00286EBB17|nr:uncharacterized protein LOC132195111 [Neocloeon triangulifer]
MSFLLKVLLEQLDRAMDNGGSVNLTLGVAALGLGEEEKSTFLTHLFTQCKRLRGELSFHDFTCLLHSNTEEFDLSYVKHHEEDQLLGLLRLKSPLIKKLTLHAPTAKRVPFSANKVSGFPHLQILITSKYFLTDSALDQLAEEHPQLKKIFIGFDGVSLEGVKSLSKLKQLTHLSLCTTPKKEDTKSDYQYLATVLFNSPKLEVLCTCDAQRFSGMLQEFKELYGCTTDLKFTKIEILDHVPYPPCKLPNVRELVAIHPVNLRQFDQFELIQKLTIRSAVPLNIDRFLRNIGHQLTHLELIHDKVSTAVTIDLDRLTRCVGLNLVHLKIEGDWIFETPRSNILNFKSLKSCIICVGWDTFPPGFLAAIIKLPVLECFEYCANNKLSSFAKAMNLSSRGKFVKNFNLKQVKLEKINPNSPADMNSLLKLLERSPNLQNLVIFTSNALESLSLHFNLIQAQYISLFPRLTVSVHPTAEEEAQILGT